MDETQKEGKGNEENSQLGVRNFFFFCSFFSLFSCCSSLHGQFTSSTCVFGQIVSREPVENNENVIRVNVMETKITKI